MFSHRNKFLQMKQPRGLDQNSNALQKKTKNERTIPKGRISSDDKMIHR